MVLLRPATKGDAHSIRALIYQVGINPLGLDWKRFVIAVDEQDRLIGCGQIKQHGDGSRELASIAVLPAWREQGIASAVIRHLLDQAAVQSDQPLYLTCRADLGPFYERFGFHVVDSDAMSPYFRRISELVSLTGRLFRRRLELLVMVHRT